MRNFELEEENSRLKAMLENKQTSAPVDNEQLNFYIQRVRRSSIVVLSFSARASTQPNAFCFSTVRGPRSRAGICESRSGCWKPYRVPLRAMPRRQDTLWLPLEGRALQVIPPLPLNHKTVRVARQRRKLRLRDLFCGLSFVVLLRGRFPELN